MRFVTVKVHVFILPAQDVFQNIILLTFYSWWCVMFVNGQKQFFPIKLLWNYCTSEVDCKRFAEKPWSTFTFWHQIWQISFTLVSKQYLWSVLFTHFTTVAKYLKVLRGQLFIKLCVTYTQLPDSSKKYSIFLNCSINVCLFLEASVTEMTQMLSKQP